MSGRAFCIGLSFVGWFIAVASAQQLSTVRLPARAAAPAPQVVEIEMPKLDTDQAGSVAVVGADDDIIGLGQIGPAKLRDTASDHSVLTMILSPGQSYAAQTVTLRKLEAPTASFAWDWAENKSADLRLGFRPVLRYMCEPLDRSTPERTGETYKAYHHLVDPRGDGLVTKGPGGLYPHHRGLFYGFNKIFYGENQADIWHCANGEYQAHVRERSTDVGPVYGRHQVQVDWHGRDGAVFATETRELTAYAADGGNLIEFRSLLTTKLPHVRLDGDPQHAGFQFRASQFVPDHTKDQTYYLRPDGKDRPGSFRNWSDKPDETDINRQHVDLPWNTLSFVLEGDRRMSCCYVDHPDNPKPARYSERDYGRFGSYFVYDLSPSSPLLVQYRLWLVDGELSAETCAALAEDFAVEADAKAGSQ